MLSLKLYLSVIAFLLLSYSDALRLLVFFPLFSKSHSMLGQAIVSKLLEAGHEVVHVTGYPRDKSEPNLTEINLVSLRKIIRVKIDERLNLKNIVGKNNLLNSFSFMFLAYDIHKKILEESIVIDFLSDPKQRFDAVILEWFYSDNLAGIAPLFECPFIWFAATEPHWKVLKLVDEIPNPSYSVDLYSSSRPPLTFLERITQFYVQISKMLLLSTILTPLQKSVYYDVFTKVAATRGVPLPPYEEVVYNGSLLLLNSHPSTGTAFRLPQNAKYIAGFHIDRNIKPLPKDIKTIMDEAKNGVIYFSLGSNVKSVDMSDYMKNSLLTLFEKLKLTIIWKFEGDLERVPPNVHLMKWAPQHSILAHPNLKFFITHGGQLSTIEALHFGVPVIGIPVFADQYVNMMSVINKGYGLQVHLAEDMAKDLEKAIEEMQGNTSYKTKAKEQSFIYHNRPRTPGDELVFWVEHVVNTKGAPHLKSLALFVPFYQKIHLDVLAVSLIILYTLIKIIKLCFTKIRLKVSKQKKN